MIDREWDIIATTVLTGMSVTSQDVLPRKDDLLVRNTNIYREANDTGKGQRNRDGTQGLAVRCFCQLGFAKVQQNDCLLYVADAQRLVVLVKY